jgi:tripartite-type tricarboxylate transporter receptor subunit TctC
MTSAGTLREAVKASWKRNGHAIADPPFKPSAGARSVRGGASSVPPACRPDIVAKLNADLRVLLPNVAVKELAFKLGYEAPSPAEEFDAIVKAEHAKWGKIVIQSGMRAHE